MMQALRASCILITTPSTRESEFSRIVRAVDPRTNQLIIRSVLLSLRCATCTAARMPGTENMPACPHRYYLIPPWIGSGEQDKLRALMATSNEAFEQEILGVSQEATGCVFDARTVGIMRENMDFTVEALARMYPASYESLDVFVGVDPSGGGDSLAAVVSFVILTPAQQRAMGMTFPSMRAVMMVRHSSRRAATNAAHAIWFCMNAYVSESVMRLGSVYAPMPVTEGGHSRMASSIGNMSRSTSSRCSPMLPGKLSSLRV